MCYIFQRKQTHIFTFYVITPYWNDPWNPFLCKTRTYLFYSQYHGYWCPSDTRCQGISNHDIYYVEPNWFSPWTLTHWGRVTHICASKLSILGSDNGLSPGRRQAIIQTNAGILLIWPLGTNFSEILIEIDTFSFRKMHLKMSSGKWRPFVLASMC